MRKISALFLSLSLSLVFAACGKVEPTDSITSRDVSSSSDEGNGYTFGEADDDADDDGDDSDQGDSDTDDTDDSDFDPDDDTDDTVHQDVTAKFWMKPLASWDASVTGYSSYPEVCLYSANATDGDWDGYGVTCEATTTANEWIYVTRAYTPGDDIYLNADWFNGQIDVYLAGANGVVNSLELYVIVQFEDDSYDVYSIVGEDGDLGEAVWVDNGSGGGDIVVPTTTNTVGSNE